MNSLGAILLVMPFLAFLLGRGIVWLINSKSEKMETQSDASSPVPEEMLQSIMSLDKEQKHKIVKAML